MKEKTVRDKSSLAFLLGLLSFGVPYVAYLLLVATATAASPGIVVWLLPPITAVCVGAYAVYHANDHIDSIDRGFLKSGKGLATAGKVLGLLAVGGGSSLHSTRGNGLADT